MLIIITIQGLIQFGLAYVGFLASVNPKYAKRYKRSFIAWIVVLFLGATYCSWRLADEADESSRKIVDSVTGGDSFAYVTPQSALIPMPLVIWNDGKYALTGVSLSIWRTAEVASYPFKSIEVGTVAAGGTPKIIAALINPSIEDVQADKNGEKIDNYMIQIQAQNGLVVQILQFRKSACSEPFAYRYFVHKQSQIKKTDGNIETNTKLLLESNWSDRACLKKNVQ